jgi:formylglycine-generating enzyme required for sulfatase activity
MMMKRIVIGLLFLFPVLPGLTRDTGNPPERPGDQTPDGMVMIPGGSFEMGIAEEDLKDLVKMGRKVPHMDDDHAMWWFGDEIPAHVVEINPFLMDIHEVTNRQFCRFVEETGYQAQGDWLKHAGQDRMDHPVIQVTWHDAAAYARWAGKRLPTEAEWEYAARGGFDFKWFPWGDRPDPARANYRHQGESILAGLIKIAGLRPVSTKPVGLYEANGYGLHDMIGNVSEWCDATYKPYPGGPEEEYIYKRYGPYKEKEKPVYGKVVRGGSWKSPNPVFIRLTHRGGFEPDHHHTVLGFRCAKSLER